MSLKPNESSPDAALRRTLETLERDGHYLDEFLAEMKRRAHLQLVERWGVDRPRRFLKTDLFEEAAGPDALLPALRDSADVLVGMDEAYAVVERARGRYAAGVPSLVADARALPFRDESFDLVLSPSTLDHFTDPAELGIALRELRRVVARNGRLIVTLDNRQNVTDWLLRLVQRLGWVPYFLGRSYTIGELDRELAAAGFEVLGRTAILHHPRLFGVAAARLTRVIGWPWLTRMVQRTFLRAQNLEHTRLRYFTGCFVAAVARPATDPPPPRHRERPGSERW